MRNHRFWMVFERFVRFRLSVRLFGLPLIFSSKNLFIGYKFSVFFQKPDKFLTMISENRNITFWIENVCFCIGIYHKTAFIELYNVVLKCPTSEPFFIKA